jgi:ABC-type oligopeptide transport system substrate-binding subunit
MKKLILVGALALAATTAQAQSTGTGSNPNSHPVQGYTTTGGTYIPPQQQTNPNSAQTGNGTRGNVNQYTGTGGTRQPK